ncbi:MAG: DUF2334 domain-containing protein [Phycisphaerales bacterium]|nr:MAG: DUF2334 domain-containing protein [Phycisphaerales bacterium]
MLVPFLFLTVASGANAPDRQVRVVLRYDDPSAITDTEMETKLIGAFREHAVACTFGIVPFRYVGPPTDTRSQEELPLPPKKAELFAVAAREGLLEIALHGYSHRAHNPLSPRPSEFAGLDYAEQRQKIQRGKAFLEADIGVEVKIFIPPWSAYDSNTIKAAEESGIEYFSADMRGPADSSSSMAFLPCTCSLTRLKEAVASARTAPGPDPIIVVLFHAYDFLESDPARGVMTFDQFKETLRWLTDQPDVRVVPMRSIPGVDSHRYALNQRLLTTPRHLPRRLRGPVYPLVLLSPEGVRIAVHRQKPVVRVIVFYGVLTLFVGFASFLAVSLALARMALSGSKFLLLSGPALVAASIAWTFHEGYFGGRMRMIMTAAGAAGYCIGTWGALLRQKCRSDKDVPDYPFRHGHSPS